MTPIVELLQHVPPLYQAVALFLAVMLGIEFGFALGQRRTAAETGDTGVVQGAILGLVGLLLAFMFSFGAARYDHRRELMVKEANAIGTAYLRTALVPKPLRAQMRGEYARYTDARLAYYRSLPASPERAAAAKDSDTLQSALWNQTTGLALKDRGPLMSLTVASLNDVIDVSAEQVDGLEDVVPGPIILLLFITVVVAGTVIGYGFGLSGARNVSYALVFAVLVTVVSFTIMDLSSPEKGLIRTKPTALEEFRATLP
jgi:hypothetical protein